MGLPIHFVVDPQGWFCVGVVFFIWLYNTLFIPKLILFPRFEEGDVSSVAIWSYYAASLLCVVSLVRASAADPGKLRESPKIPLTEKELWELCNKCNMMRPKRSHHCSRCGHCVRRMDHHCPWINNCVGEDNHWLFLQLCFYTQVLSGYTLILDFCHYYYFLPLKSISWDLFVFQHELALVRISTFMGILMFGGMGSLFYTQIMGILTDTTTIEKMSNCCEETQQILPFFWRTCLLFCVTVSTDRGLENHGSRPSQKFLALAGRSCGLFLSGRGDHCESPTTLPIMSKQMDGGHRWVRPAGSELQVLSKRRYDSLQVNSNTPTTLRHHKVPQALF